MPEVRTIAALEKYIRDKINDCLVNEVADDIAEVESEIIRENVYGAYSPHVYSRRGQAGGLADPGNIKGELIGDGILSVENKTEFNSGYNTSNQGEGLAGLVEYGNGYGGHEYDYAYRNPDASYIGPRPFIDETREIVANGIVDSIAAALADRGLKVKR